MSEPSGDASSDRSHRPGDERAVPRRGGDLPGGLEELAVARWIETLTEQGIFGVYVIQDGTFRYVNETLAGTFGYRPDELVHRLGPLDLVAPEDREANLERRLAGEVSELRYAFRGLKKDGSRIWVEVHGGRTEVDGAPAVVGALLDITERKELERQVVQAQKMEAVGLMASGIAHDFNNVLTAITGNIDLLLHGSTDPDEVQRGLREIRAAAERARKLTREILTFGRGGEAARESSAELDRALAEIREMVTSMTGDDVEVEWSFGADEFRVPLDVSRLGQVLMNLVVNARDAMPDGGRISIRTRTVHLEEEYARSHLDLEPGRYAQLSVRDTGHGMDPATRERIFEPFFSTKEAGEGTGLGLSTVYGIVRDAGGHVWVYSEPGQGTHFKIHLPRERAPATDADPAAEKAEARESPAPDRLEGSETVLLVDDDPAVRTVSAKILERYGYTVLLADDADAAIRAFAEHGDRVDLLLSDVVLPGLSGPELRDRLAGSGAAFGVVFMSGYTERSVNREARLRPGAAFLEKPFDPAELIRTVRRTLDADAGSRPESA